MIDRFQSIAFLNDRFQIAFIARAQKNKEEGSPKKASTSKAIFCGKTPAKKTNFRGKSKNEARRSRESVSRHILVLGLLILVISPRYRSRYRRV